MNREEVRKAIRELKEERDEGLLDEEEYQKERQRLMAQWRQSTSGGSTPASAFSSTPPPSGGDFFGRGGQASPSISTPTPSGLEGWSSTTSSARVVRHLLPSTRLPPHPRRVRQGKC